jgi:RNA polymerase sigma-70 factor, ECF subfamily
MSLDNDLEQLFRAHSAMLYRTAYGLVGNAADSEDVLQTIFLRLLRSGLPSDIKRNATGYLYRAAVNVSLDVVRARKRYEASTEARYAQTSNGVDSNSVEETHRRLAQSLASLDPEAAQILILKYVHGYKDADIARTLNSSRGAVAMRLLRCRFRLKELMRELGEKQ